MRVPVAVVTGADVDDVDVAAEDVRDDLRRGRLVPLALRGRPERDDDLAEDVELDRRDLVVPRELEVGVEELRLAEVVRPRVERRADPDAEQLPARRGLRAPLLDRVVADQLERHVERPRVVTRVVDTAVRRLVRHLLGLDVVPLAQLDAVEAELVRDDVDDPLGQPEVLHPRVAAVRRDGRLVRHHLRELDADVAPAVHARARPATRSRRRAARSGGTRRRRRAPSSGSRVIVPSALTATSVSRNQRSLPCDIDWWKSVRHSVHWIGPVELAREQAAARRAADAR